MFLDVINTKSKTPTEYQRPSRKIIIGLVQINNSFSKQNYLPLSIGFLQSYANEHVDNIDDFEFILPIYKRVPVEDAVEHLCKADIVAFSLYVWNFRISIEIARRLKERSPQMLIVVGGCHVPDNNTEQFMRDHRYIDLACTGEGEITFASILQNYYARWWEGVPSLHYINNDNQYVMTPAASRIENLNDIPSPFLSGVFKPLMASTDEEEWIGLWETNRGCPFKCTFCDWGVGSKKRMADYSMDRILQEIDWFSEHNIKFVYCCDANFGMYKDRDLEIAQKFAENKSKFGCPEAFSVQNTKNSTEASYNIQKVLAKSGLSKGVLLAFQSLYKPALKAIKRDNIKLETFFDLQKKFTEDGVETFSDIILGLPEETYDTFVDGISTLISLGQHNRMQFNNLSVLPNAEMGDVSYQQKYGLEIVESKTINIHGSISGNSDEVYETQQLVIASNTMPRDKWVQARTFAFMSSLCHFNKLLQIPFIIIHKNFGISYGDLIKTCLDKFGDIRKFFVQKSEDIQRGDPEYCPSREWLNIWWPADEYIFIDLVLNNKLSDFYKKALEVLSELEVDRSLVKDSIELNKSMIKIPFCDEDLYLVLSHNVWELYSKNVLGEDVDIIRESHKYHVDRSTETWASTDEWCRHVVWYGNKRGAYLYKVGDV